ncbi:MAG: hypothetical protein AAF950_12735 [Pseudomonadota bacterium]
MERKIIPLYIQNNSWVLPSEFDHQIRTVEQCTEFLSSVVDTLLGELEKHPGETTVSSEDQNFYRSELPIVRQDIEDAISQIQYLVERIQPKRDRPSA